MDDAILVINAGSSSIKFSLFVAREDTLALYVHGQMEGLHTSPHFIAREPSGVVVAENTWGAATKLGHDGAVDYLARFIRLELTTLRHIATGHRVVHGGLNFLQPVRIDRAVLSELEKLVPLAPLHQPHNLAPIRFLLEVRPDLPQVACFDTSFHRTNSLVAEMFALPKALTEAGIRRYGFHGLSYEYIASTLSQFDERAGAGKTVALHLGNGSSMCAMKAGVSVATTMGFTAVEGLPMGTRCGALDPGVILYLMDERGMDARAVEKLIYQQSGLLGVSGISSDMRALLASPAPDAQLAIDLYVYRIGRELGSLTAALGGLDAIVFTAGIGENAAEIRARVCRDAAWLGLELDPSANDAGGPRISTEKSSIGAWVIPTNEDLMIARHTLRVLKER